MSRTAGPISPRLVTQVLIGSLSLVCLSATQGKATTDLGLKDFLNQVNQDNTGVKSSSLSSKANELKANEAHLVTSPSLYANVETKRDTKITPFSFLQYDALTTQVASLGVMQTFDLGMQAKLHYELLTVQYINPQTSQLGPGFGAIFSNPYHVASPVLEITQSLWNNGFGRTTRASQEAIEARNLSASHQYQFATQSALVQAELAYWRLAAARQVIEVQNQAIDRARKIYEWNQNRVKLHLGDEADTLQAEALLQSRGLDVLSAQNEERAAARAFNLARNQDSDSVGEKLHRLEMDELDSVEVPKRSEFREDLRAARESVRATEADSIIQTEKNKPTLEAYGSVSLNGQPQNPLTSPYNGSVSLSQTLALSFAPNRPSYNVGVRFSMPLAFETVSQSQEAWRQEKMAAELNYERKLLEQEDTWKDSVQKLTESRQHLRLSQELEITQKKKLETEKERLKRGRTTTYQVLLFEQDYLFSQLGRIKDQIALLNILAQMKLFGESR